MLKIKQAENYLDAAGNPREIKYSMAYTSHECEVACRCVDCFVLSPSWFRAIVVDTKTQFDLNRFGRKYESDAIKWARAYKKFAELLLSHNCAGVENAVLLTDRLTRTKGDQESIQAPVEWIRARSAISTVALAKLLAIAVPMASRGRASKVRYSLLAALGDAQRSELDGFIGKPHCAHLRDAWPPRPLLRPQLL